MRELCEHAGGVCGPERAYVVRAGELLPLGALPSPRLVLVFDREMEARSAQLSILRGPIHGPDGHSLRTLKFAPPLRGPSQPSGGLQSKPLQ